VREWEGTNLTLFERPRLAGAPVQGIALGADKQTDDAGVGFGFKAVAFGDGNR
jgi:hypothetical protein